MDKDKPIYLFNGMPLQSKYNNNYTRGEKIEIVLQLENDYQNHKAYKQNPCLLNVATLEVGMILFLSFLSSHFTLQRLIKLWQVEKRN
jgi:hypothetical protein